MLAAAKGSLCPATSYSQNTRWLVIICVSLLHFTGNIFAASVIPLENRNNIYNRSLAKFLVEHASAVYIDSATELLAWNCSRCNGLTEGFNISRLIIDDPKTLQAYVGVQENLGYIVVAFRGTRLRSLVNWIADLYFVELNLEYPGVKSAFVHSGFYSAYHNTSLRGLVIDEVQKLLAERPYLRVVVTGHSLGAALACLCALDLTVNIQIQGLHVTTFGQPRIGNFNFAKYFDERVPSSIRMVHGNDMVPHLPPQSPIPRLHSYYHTATEVWIHKLRWLFGEVEDVCDSSGEDWHCSRSVPGYSILDHLEYLGVVLGEEDKIDYAANNRALVQSEVEWI